ncbi:MAG: glycosyltransferase involved in cell wall biosynthesis [Verrucomicrobiales bacterium]|jgi:glycosyltransferase involved in cell wall biosynthesis
MNIAITTTMIQRGKSGVAQYVFALVRELRAYSNTHTFSLLVLEEDLPLFAFAENSMQLIPVAEKWRPAIRNVLWHQVVLPRWLRKNAIDIVHVPSYRRMVRFAPCAKVATIHDLAPFQLANKYDPARMFYGRVVVKRLARHQQSIVAVSSNTADNIATYFKIPRPRIEVILNGVDRERFSPSKAAPPNQSAEPPFFLYVSRLEHPGKNHVRLIEAFNAFKKTTGSNWQLAFGGSDWHGAEQIHAAIAASPYVGDIRALGFVPDCDLPNLYRTAGALVYPSLFEGFGLPPVEAMACGCPVISSPNGSLDEVIGDAAYRIDPENLQSMVEALTKVASDPACRARLRDLGFLNATRFDWRDNAARMMEVYQQALDDSPVARSARQDPNSLTNAQA